MNRERSHLVMPPLIEAVLFDLDETLTDRSASILRYAAVFHDDFAGLLGDTSVEEIATSMAVLDDGGYRPRDEVYAGLAQELPWRVTSDAHSIGEHWRNQFPMAAVERVGLYETLTALERSGLGLGIVTNGSVLTQSAKIDRLDLRRYMRVVVISEAVGVRKPDPAIFRQALDGLGASAATTMFVGDHPTNDVIGAREAGLIPVWFEGAKHAWPSDVDLPERRIQRLADVLDLVSAGAGAS